MKLHRMISNIQKLFCKKNKNNLAINMSSNGCDSLDHRQHKDRRSLNLIDRLFGYHREPHRNLIFQRNLPTSFSVDDYLMQSLMECIPSAKKTGSSNSKKKNKKHQAPKLTKLEGPAYVLQYELKGKKLSHIQHGPSSDTLSNSRQPTRSLSCTRILNSQIMGSFLFCNNLSTVYKLEGGFSLDRPVFCLSIPSDVVPAVRNRKNSLVHVCPLSSGVHLLKTTTMNMDSNTNGMSEFIDNDENVSRKNGTGNTYYESSYCMNLMAITKSNHLIHYVIDETSFVVNMKSVLDIHSISYDDGRTNNNTNNDNEYLYGVPSASLFWEDFNRCLVMVSGRRKADHSYQLIMMQFVRDQGEDHRLNMPRLSLMCKFNVVPSVHLNMTGSQVGGIVIEQGMLKVCCHRWSHFYDLNHLIRELLPKKSDSNNGAILTNIDFKHLYSVATHDGFFMFNATFSKFITRQKISKFSKDKNSRILFSLIDLESLSTPKQTVESIEKLSMSSFSVVVDPVFDEEDKGPYMNFIDTQSTIISRTPFLIDLYGIKHNGNSGRETKSNSTLETICQFSAQQINGSEQRIDSGRPQRASSRNVNYREQADLTHIVDWIIVEETKTLFVLLSIGCVIVIDYPRNHVRFMFQVEEWDDEGNYRYSIDYYHGDILVTRVGIEKASTEVYNYTLQTTLMNES